MYVIYNEARKRAGVVFFLLNLIWLQFPFQQISINWHTFAVYMFDLVVRTRRKKCMHNNSVSLHPKKKLSDLHGFNKKLDTIKSRSVGTETNHILMFNARCGKTIFFCILIQLCSTFSGKEAFFELNFYGLLTFDFLNDTHVCSMHTYTQTNLNYKPTDRLLNSLGYHIM